MTPRSARVSRRVDDGRDATDVEGPLPGTGVAQRVVARWRVTHLAFVGSDPIVLRFAGLRRLPADRTVVRWLKRFSSQALLALGTLIRDLVHEPIESTELARSCLRS